MPEPTPPDPLKWWELELKIRDLHGKKSTDAFKVSADFSRLVMTNLHLLNAGGLVALPYWISLAGAGALPLAAKVEKFGPPAAFFVAGLLLASLCALATYFNFQRVAQRVDLEERKEVSDLRKSYPTATTDQVFQDEIAKHKDELTRLIARWETRLTVTYWVGHIAGWGSMTSFIAGCIWLALSIR